MEAIEILPIDCWRFIFNHLDKDGLEVVSLVCKDFLAISNFFKDSLLVVHPGIGMLSKHLNRFKQLKRINLGLFRGDLRKAILEIIRCDVSLDVLEIPGFKFKSTIQPLKELDTNAKLKNLKTLNCGRYPFPCLCDYELDVIANALPNLEQISFGNYSFFSRRPRATNYGVELLASKLKFLKKIHIDGAQKVYDSSIIALSLNCSFLIAVTIYNENYNNGISENGIGHLLRNRPNLEALSVRGINPSESTITIENSISYAKALASLKFNGMVVSDMLLNTIAKAKLPLKKFELTYCWNFTVSGLLVVLPYLTTLRMVNMDLRQFLGMVLKGDAGKLRRIRIRSCQNVTNSILFILSTKCPSLVEIAMGGQVPNIVNQTIQLPEIHNILNLCLERCEFGDESIKNYALMFPNLKDLTLNPCIHVTSTGIEAILKSCKFIRKLRLVLYHGKKLINDDNLEIPEVINLEELRLYNTLVDDEGLAAIAKRCGRLVSLNLNVCRNVTSDGIKQIVKNITTLRCLTIFTISHGICSDVLQWMLSTGNFASLKEIHVEKSTKEHTENFLRHGILLLEPRFRR